MFFYLRIIEHNKAANSLETLNKLKKVLIMSNSYEQKQAAKKERYLEMANNATARSAAAAKQSSDMGRQIPFGQPVLVGHHSEKRDRAFRARIGGAMDKSVVEARKAEHYERKAASVGTGGISSDDPAAVAKLNDQLAKAEKLQTVMKETNAIIRKHAKAGKETQLKALLEKGDLTEKQAAGALEPDCFKNLGFASFTLTNNNANIKRIKGRIAALEASAKRVDAEVTGAGYVCRECTEENRVMFIFDGKPAEPVRNILKRFAFKWSPSRGAWVRMLNGSGVHAAKTVIAALAALEA